MINEVMIHAMNHLLEKRANTDEFNRMYYEGYETDTTLDMVEKIEGLFELIRINRKYQKKILCQKKNAVRPMDAKTVEHYANLQEEMAAHIEELKFYTEKMEKDIAW